MFRKINTSLVAVTASIFMAVSPLSVMAAGDVIDITDNAESSSIDFPDAPVLRTGMTAADTEEGIERKRSGWKITEEGRKYCLLDGTFATGMTEIGGDWYLFDDDGVPLSGWTERNGHQVYVLNDGLLANGVQEIGDELYIFDTQGRPVSGWNMCDGTVYYSNENGIVQTGWFKDGSRKYLAMEDGAVKEGWIILGDKTCYQTKTGVLTGIQEVDGEIKIFGEDGTLCNGFVELNGMLYASDSDGNARTGFFEKDNERYYANAYGRILKGWNQIDNKWYYFDPDDGHMHTGSAKYGLKEISLSQSGEAMVQNFNPLALSAPFSISYNASIYEGEKADFSNISISDTNAIFTLGDMNPSYFPAGDEWDESIGEETGLSVQTDYGISDVTLTSVRVKDMEATYTGSLYTGCTPMIQDIRLYAVYEDGKKAEVSSFACSLPEKLEGDTVVEITSDIGNAELKLSLPSTEDFVASYDGAVREGETPNIDKIKVWSVSSDGYNRYTNDFTCDEPVISEDTSIELKVGKQTVKCKIKCIPIDSVKVSGAVSSDESLDEKALIVRYADGSTKTISADKYEWISDETIVNTVNDNSSLKINYLGKEYNVTFDVIDVATNLSNGIVVSGGASDNYTTRKSLGVWTLTAYSDTPSDQGQYVGQTASGASLVEGRTVAVSKSTMERHGLVFGDKLEINGHVYTIEDHGGSPMDNKDWVDIFVADPSRAYSSEYNTPSEVFLLR